MPSNLRSEIQEVIASGLADQDLSNNEKSHVITSTILALVESRMPEKEYSDVSYDELLTQAGAQGFDEGWNAYHNEVKSILRSEE